MTGGSGNGADKREFVRRPNVGLLSTQARSERDFG